MNRHLALLLSSILLWSVVMNKVNARSLNDLKVDDTAEQVQDNTSSSNESDDGVRDFLYRLLASSGSNKQGAITRLRQNPATEIERIRKMTKRQRLCYWSAVACY